MLTVYVVLAISLMIDACLPVFNALQRADVVMKISPLILGATIVGERSKECPFMCSAFNGYSLPPR